MVYADPEKAKQRHKEYYEKNKEECRRKRREYYHKNKKELLEKQKEYAKNNKEKISLRSKKYREDNIELHRERERKYKNTFNGIMTRRISSWTLQGGLKETPERKVLIFYRWYYSQKCELCYKPYKNKSERCMEHHHSSGHFRSICCGNCNKYISKIDRIKQCVLLELHRYFLTNESFDF